MSQEDDPIIDNNNNLLNNQNEKANSNQHLPRPSSQQEHQQDSDLDLEDAIGDVFNQFNFEGNNENTEIRHHQQNQDKDQEKLSQQLLSSEIRHTSDNKHSDDMNNAIDDTFNDIFQTNQQHSQNQDFSPHGQNQNIHNNANDDNMDLNNAIGDAFDGMFHEESDRPRESEYANTDPNQDSEKNKDDDDLSNAIGDVFDNMFNSDRQTHSESNLRKQTEDEANSRKNHNLPPPEKNNVQNDTEEESLDDVIGNAFDSMFSGNENTKPSESNQQADDKENLSSQDKDTIALNQQQSSDNHQILANKDEDNLDDAIEIAFDNVFEQQKQSNDSEKSTTENNATTNEARDKNDAKETINRSDDSKSSDEDNLDVAIGDAFNNSFENNNKSAEKLSTLNEKGSSKSIRNTSNEIEADKQEENLDHAIGDAFSNIFEAQNQNQNQEGNQLPIENTETTSTSNKGDSVSNVNKDDLAHIADESNKTVTNINHENTSIQSSTTSNTLQIRDSNNNNDDKPEESLEDAIGDAFSNIFANENTSKHSTSSNDSSRQTNDKNTSKDKDNDKQENLDYATIFSRQNQQYLKEKPPITNVLEHIPKSIKAVPNAKSNVKSTSQDEFIDPELSNLMSERSSISLTKQNKNKATVPKPSTTIEEQSIDDELNNAIGDAFKDMFGKSNIAQPDSSPKTTTAQPSAAQDSNNLDDDLENAIGSAFSGIFGNQNKQAPPKPQPQQSFDKVTGSSKEVDDGDLDSAPVSAIKDILGVSKPNDKVEEDDLDDVIGNAFNNILQHEKEWKKVSSTRKDSLVGDDELNEIVSQSFQQIFQSQPQQQSLPKEELDEMEDAISQAFKSVMNNQRKPSEAVQNLVSQIPPTIPNKENYVKKLAVEISHQVQDHLKHDRNRLSQQQPFISGLPRLDESILAHFETKDTGSNSNVADLEQLQMNDILQNAFKMAIERPNELLSDLEIEEEIPKEISKPIFRPSIRKLESPIIEEPKTRPSLLSNPAVTSQLSSVISSLTSRINSGELSNANILSVIRQMTEELSSGRSLTLTSSFLKKPINVDTIIESYKAENLLKIINILKYSIKYLQIVSSIDGDNAINIIRSIIRKFDPMNENEEIVSLEIGQIGEITKLFNFTMSLIVKYSSGNRFSPSTLLSIEKIKLNGPRINSSNNSTNSQIQNQISQNSDTKKLVTDLYNLFSGSLSLDNSLSMVISTAITISFGIYSIKTPESSIEDSIKGLEIILISIFESTPGMTNYKDASPLNKDKLQQLLLSTNKRKNENIDGNEYKRRFISTATDTELNYLNLKMKMPSYKRNSIINDKTITQANNVKTSLKLPRNSPFLSNKIKSTTPSPSTVSVSANLKKPGSFQKPTSFQKPNATGEKHKASSLGFPKLFSTSH
ncbi:unnamed protein product [Candida verbasci]|uniref:Uncharacterized protein n=1 Tax=Candida verbasci TaxID=1227364 RepID=A0A9W4XER8_9ASCO|nr:unnamed protein product [Candida verbasci]